jgi:class 3 adenylate cyclase/pimeloyl-ACP methyl ester carboxylesterase
VKPPKTQYAQSGEFSIAYQVVGDGPIDLVHIPGMVSHLDHAWTHPNYERFMRSLSSFARVIVYDKRGTGLSDPFLEMPSVEERIDDTRAVMDAVGSDRAAVFGCSEGSTLGAIFAATYPERVSGAILYGTFARLTPDPPDYPWGFDEFMTDQYLTGIQKAWGEGVLLTLLAPSALADDAEREWWGGFERTAISRRVLGPMTDANIDLDIRRVLPTIRVPTLLLHRRGDMFSVEGARYVAERIPGARLIEMDGEDHWPWAWRSDPEEVCGHVEEFVTGSRQAPATDRVLATVLFTDIVGSTETASEMGDRRWRELLDAHEQAFRRELERQEGHEVKSTGDGFLATFDGPARAIRCAKAASAATRALGIEIRAGIHTGECERRNGDIGGIAVHIGARVMSRAGPGEVLVSNTVKDLTVGSDIEFEERGEHQLKGVPGSWHLYAAR